jgi:hypothetical protein
MRNILLQKDKDRLHREHKLRKVVLVLVFIFVTILIALFLLIPSYIASEYKESNTLEYASVVKKSIEAQEKSAVGLVLNNTNIKLQLLSSDKDEMLFGDMVKKIIENKSEGIKISGFFYTKKDEDKDEILVAGIASQRSTLLQFQRDLEDEDMFFDAILPTSSLASDKDIEFSIKVIGKF